MNMNTYNSALTAQTFAYETINYSKQDGVKFFHYDPDIDRSEFGNFDEIMQSMEYKLCGFEQINGSVNVYINGSINCVLEDKDRFVEKYFTEAI